MKVQTTSLILKLVLILSFASSCTKGRQAELPEDEQENIFAMSDFSLNPDSPLTIQATSVAKVLSDVSATSALLEKPLVQIDAIGSQVPSRLRFMFKDLSVAANSGENVKITFSVDSKAVTAFKIVNSKSQLTTLEKQLAVSPKEVQQAIAMQRLMNQTAKFHESQKALALAKTERVKNVLSNSEMMLLVPLFKYEIKAAGILQRTKNELKEQTAVLKLKETDFDQATHIKISISAADRKEIGSFEQRKDLAQLFTAAKLDNRVTTQEQLSSDLQIQLTGKFSKADSQVLSRLDAKDLKLYEIMTENDLTKDQLRLLNLKAGNNEIMTCADAKVDTAKVGCVIVLRAKVPVKYKTAKLTLAAGNGSENNIIELEETTKKEAMGLVFIAKNTVAESVQPTGAIDPQNTMKVADLKGEYLFRRTVEDASNAFMGEVGTSSDTFLVNFELQDHRLVVRSTQTLAKYFGQGIKDREEIMSFEASYFKMQKTDESGNTLLVPTLEKTSLKEAEYVQINWLKNTIPDSSSPMAFYGFGQCIVSAAGQQITDPRIELNEGIINFSVESSITVRPDCTATLDLNSANFWANPTQFNFTVKERISFKKNPESANVVLGSVPPQVQNALNYNGLTIAELNTGAKAPSSYNLKVHEAQTYKVAQHNFHNGGKLIYHVGGLETADPSRKDILIKVTEDVVKDWNAAFRRAFKGTSLERNEDYVEVRFDSAAHKGNLGDLDRSYIWYFDLPFENGALGIAQPSIHPRSAQITTSNVLMYSGNMSDNLKYYYEMVTKQREYERLVEQVKAEKTKEILAKWTEIEKAEAAQNAAANSGIVLRGSTGTASIDAGKNTQANPTFTQKLLIEARSKAIKYQTSKYDGLTVKLAASKARFSEKAKNYLGSRVRNEVVDLNKRDFSKRVIEKIFKDDLAKDPAAMEILLAKEFYNTDPSLTPQAKILLQNKIQLTEMKARFDKNFKARFGCKVEGTPFDLGQVNDAFLKKSFNESFEGIMKWVLAHEMGHAFGLIHNFKGSFDKENYAFEGEKTERTYSTVMDYIAYSEAPYHGIGTYDVHAIRAIYTEQVEIAKHLTSIEEMSAYFKKIAKIYQMDKDDQAIVFKQLDGQFKRVQSVKLNQGRYIKISDLKKVLDLPAANFFSKENIARMNIVKHFHQCHDSEKYTDVRCMPYDWGSSATEVVKNYIRSYERSYASGYHIRNRIEFGWNEKVSILRRSLSTFGSIRSYLDQAIMMEYGKARNPEEIMDFKQASFEGLKFFSNIIRIPDTHLSVGIGADGKPSKEVIAARLYPLMAKNSDTGEKIIEFIEAKRVYDNRITTDKIETIGIGMDKSFALQFLFQSSPIELGDDSTTGFTSYLDFEKMAFDNYSNPENSFIIQSMSSILSGNLAPGKFLDNGMFLSLDNQEVADLTAKVTSTLTESKSPRLPTLRMNMYLLNGAIQNAVFGLNETKMRGFDPFAEFFKVGRSEGGQILSDRPSVRRAFTKAESQSAVRFWSADNANGAHGLVNSAAAYEKVSINIDEFAKATSDYLLKYEELLITQNDPAKKDQIPQKESELKQEGSKALKLFTEKLNKEGLLDGRSVGAEKILLSQLQTTVENTLVYIEQFVAKVDEINSSNPAKATDIVKGLSEDIPLRQGLNMDVAGDPMVAVAQFAALYYMDAKKVVFNAGDHKAVPAGQVFAGSIVKPLEVIQAVLDEKTAILENLNMFTIYTNPEYKR